MRKDFVLAVGSLILFAALILLAGTTGMLASRFKEAVMTLQRCQEYPGTLVLTQRTRILTGELACTYRPLKYK